MNKTSKCNPWRALAATLLLAGGSVGGPAGAAVAPPLERPATPLRAPDHGALLGIAHAGPRLVAVGERGAILLSDSGGRSWRQAAGVPVSVTLTAVQFVDASAGWAVGHEGLVLRTDDGGEHWQRVLDGRQIAQRMQEEAERSGNAQALAEAARLVQEGADKPLLALSFSDREHGIVTGAFNLALETADGGRSWRSVSLQLPNPKALHLYAVHRMEHQLLIAGEQGLLLHSADDGVHFERVATPYNGSLFVVAAAPDGSWWIGGLRGHVYHSPDQGRSWGEWASPVPASITSIDVDGQGQVRLLNQAGQLLRPGPDGNALAVDGSTTVQQPAALLLQAGDAAVVAGWSGILRVPVAQLAKGQ